MVVLSPMCDAVRGAAALRSCGASRVVVCDLCGAPAPAPDTAPAPGRYAGCAFWEGGGDGDGVWAW